MVFNSLTFLVFFAVVLAAHHLPFLSWRTKKVNLLAASYVFYAAWNPPFILLLWASTVVDWFIARAIWASRERSRAVRRSWLVISVAVNIGFIGFFKYGEFLLQNWQALMQALGVVWVAPEWDIVLPVGSKIVSQSLSGNRLSIDAELADGGRAIFVYDIAERRIVGQFAIRNK